MNIKMLQTSYIAAALLIPIAISVNGAGRPSQVADGSQESHQEQSSGLTAKITWRDGATRNVTLEGVGCSASICSRVAIQAKAERDSLVRTPFESIAAIKDTTEHDALFVLKDGTERRLSLLTDFRVLYLTNESRASEKLDLAKVKSIEFLAPGR
jgi:hypothetical protein